MAFELTMHGTVTLTVSVKGGCLSDLTCELARHYRGDLMLNKLHIPRLSFRGLPLHHPKRMNRIGPSIVIGVAGPTGAVTPSILINTSWAAKQTPGSTWLLRIVTAARQVNGRGLQ